MKRQQRPNPVLTSKCGESWVNTKRYRRMIYSSAATCHSQVMPPPWHGSSPAQFVCGGAQRGVSLATGFFTGESRRNPLGGNLTGKCHNISILYNHDFSLLDSFVKSTKSSLPNPLGQPNPASQAPSKQRFDPRPWNICALPDRDVTGPLAATPHSCAHRVWSALTAAA